mgnify:CR=1 FL=1
MKTNNKTINHLFSYLLDELLGKKMYFIFQSSDDITSKKVKSILKKYDASVAGVPSSELRFMGVLTDKECNEYQKRNHYGSYQGFTEVHTIDFAEFQKEVK